MEIRLRPEVAEIIKQDVERGTYASVDEFVEHAISLLHSQEEWLAANRSEVEAKIVEGYAAAQRGELMDEDEVKRRLHEMKQSRGRTASER
jgi:Arc/MetJ-type ribon-helix-helix transcriptional regulator